MSVIEGIGDEVVQFFSVLLIVTLAVAAWWSTSIRETHNIRTVLILERRSRNRTAGEVQAPTVAADTDNAIDTGQEEADGVETELLTDDNDKDEGEATSATSVTGGEETTSCTVEESATEASESPDEPTLKKRLGATLLTEETSNSTSQTESEGDQIRIRLKYLNDDQKLVEGRLQEQLGDFKRRHFNLELSADKLVRLIFNGQVLGSDQQTLQACGLFDNCVVHCLVHSQRTQPRNSTATHTATPPSQPSPPDWNLSTLLYACLSLVLCLVWYCRYQYAQLFTLTTTAALIGLTGIFTVSIFSLYLPDQDGIPH